MPSAVFLFRYAWQVWSKKAPPTSLASFGMWAVLDGLLFYNTVCTGKPIWLPFGWMLGSTTVTAVLYFRGTREWTKRESLSLICATIAAAASVISGGRVGLIMTVIAMSAAGMPILIDNLKTPIRATFMLWFTTVVSCALSLLGSDWSFDGTFLPWCSLFYNGFMAYLVMRKPKAALAAT